MDQNLKSQVLQNCIYHYKAITVLYFSGGFGSIQSMDYTELQAEQIKRETEGWDERCARAISKAEQNQSDGKAAITIRGLKAITKNFDAVEGAIERLLRSHTKGRMSDAYKLLSLLEPKQSAFIILLAVLRGALRTVDGNRASIQDLSIDVCKALEVPIPQEDRPDWNDEKRLKVGAWCVGMIAEETDLIQFGERPSRKKSPLKTVEPSNSLAKDAKYYNLIFRQRYEPMICPPRPWHRANGGGYLTTKYTLIQGKNFHPDQIKNLNPATMPKVFAAVNALQAVPWKINKVMLETIHELWCEALDTGDYSLFIDLDKIPKKKHKQRIKQLEVNVEMILREADDYAQFDRFWLPVYLDFRGRVYYRPALNPQGGDLLRSLLDFADEKPFSSGSSYPFFYLHGHKLAGPALVDKINPSTDLFEPQKNWWRGAKKKMMFLRWCLEHDKLKSNKNSKTGMPCYIDATQSGTQHFALLLRNKEMGTMVNLTVNSRRDAYREAADVLNKQILRSSDEWSSVWRNHNFTRDDTKPMVMCIPYQKTDFSYLGEFCERYHNLLEEHCKTNSERDDATKWLLNQMKQAVEAVLPEINKIPEWLKSVAQAAGNKHIEWQTPSGFIVRQRYYKYKSKQIDVKFYNIKQKFSLRRKTEKISTCKTKFAIVANFVHSLDASALVETVISATKANIPLGVVHDCFCAPICDITEMHRSANHGLKDTHVDNLLQHYKRYFESSLGTELPEIPKQGDLRIEDISLCWHDYK